MTTIRVWVTGPTGCIGHYVIQELLQFSNIEIHILARNPQALLLSDPRIVIHKGNLDNLQPFAETLAQMTHIIHIATTWAGYEHCRKINIDATMTLLKLTNPDVLQHVIYFSTASILGRGNVIIDEAGQYGSSYIRTKHEAYFKIKESPYANKVTTVFPTVVIGGDKVFPKSHISEGLLPNLKFLSLLKFFDFDASFHFLHGKDIAKVCVHLLFNPQQQKDFALGNERIFYYDAIRTLCTVFGKWKAPFQIRFTPSRIFKLASLFRIKIGPWERYCIENPHMTYDTIHPGTFGLPRAFPTFESVVSDIKHFSE